MGYMEVPNLQTNDELYQYLDDMKATTLQNVALMQDILFPVIIAVGVVANLFVIGVILIWERNRTNRSVTQLFAVNLAVADFLFVCTLPLYGDALSRNWRYGDFFCRVKRGMDHLNYHSSILFLTVMSLDRLLATVYLIKMRIYRTRRNATYACVVVWLIAIATAAPYAVYANVRPARYIDEKPICSIDFPGVNNVATFTESDYKKHFNTTPNANNSNALEEMLLRGMNVTSNNTSLGNDNADQGHSSSEDALLSQLNFEKVLEEELRIIGGLDLVNTTQKFDADDPITSVHIKDCENFYQKSSPEFMGYMWFKFFAFYVIPVTLIVGSYVTILFTATKRLKRMPENQKRMRKHMVVTILVMVSAFIICWSPLLIWNVLTSASVVVVNRFGACHIYESVFEVMAYANSALNPILYWLSSKSFRGKIRAVYEYLTKGRNLSSLVVMKREDSTHTRTSRLFRDPSTRMALPPKDAMLLQPVGEETKEELEAELITRPNKKKPLFHPVQEATEFVESDKPENDDKKPIATAASPTDVKEEKQDR